MDVVLLVTSEVILFAPPIRMPSGMVLLMYGRNVRIKVVARMEIVDVAMAEAEAGAEAIATAMVTAVEMVGVIPDLMASAEITPRAMVIVALGILASSFIPERREEDVAMGMAMAIPTTMVRGLS
jgi:hypothetical protein